MKMASPYSLRSRLNEQQSPPVVGPPEIIPCRQGTSQEGNGASNGEAQTTFLEMVGLLESAETISIEPTLSPEEAVVFSSALNHDYDGDMDGEDKYFTPDKHTRLLLQEAKICRRYAQRSEEAVQQGTSILNTEAKSYWRSTKAVQKCVIVLLTWVSDIAVTDFLRTDPAVTDSMRTVWDDWYRCPPYLTKSIDMSWPGPYCHSSWRLSSMINPCLPGSSYTVNFVMRITDRPDFTIDRPTVAWSQDTPWEERGKCSLPGTRRRESTTAALTQAGVYTVGQFMKQEAYRLPAIILHKDKSVQVAMASLSGNDKTSDNSLGTVAFKLVGQMDPVDLKAPDGLRTFSGLLKGIMDTTQQPQN